MMTNIMAGGRLVFPPDKHGATSRRPMDWRYEDPYHGGSGEIGRRFGDTGIPGGDIRRRIGGNPGKDITQEWTYTVPGWLRKAIAAHVGLNYVPGTGKGINTVTITAPGPTSGKDPKFTVKNRVVR